MCAVRHDGSDVAGVGGVERHTCEHSVPPASDFVLSVPVLQATLDAMAAQRSKRVWGYHWDTRPPTPHPKAETMLAGWLRICIDSMFLNL